MNNFLVILVFIVVVLQSYKENFNKKLHRRFFVYTFAVRIQVIDSFFMKSCLNLLFSDEEVLRCILLTGGGYNGKC